MAQFGVGLFGSAGVLTTDVTRRTEMPEPDDWAVVYDLLVALAPEEWGAKQDAQGLMERVHAETAPISAEQLPFLRRPSIWSRIQA